MKTFIRKSTKNYSYKNYSRKYNRFTFSYRQVNCFKSKEISLQTTSTSKTSQGWCVSSPWRIPPSQNTSVSRLVEWCALMSIQRWCINDRYCRSLIKVKFSTDQFRPALGSCGCRLSVVDWLWPCSKNLKTALFQTFSTWQPNTFCPYCLILT